MQLFPFLHQLKLGKVNHIFHPTPAPSVQSLKSGQVKEETEFTNMYLCSNESNDCCDQHHWGISHLCPGTDEDRRTKPASSTSDLNTQTQTLRQHFLTLSQQSCNTSNLLFIPLHTLRQCLSTAQQRLVLQIVEQDSYWKGSAAIQGQSLYVHLGAASTAPLSNPEDTHTHRVKSKGITLFLPLHHKSPKIEMHAHKPPASSPLVKRGI